MTLEQAQAQYSFDYTADLDMSAGTWTLRFDPTKVFLKRVDYDRYVRAQKKEAMAVITSLRDETSSIANLPTYKPASWERIQPLNGEGPPSGPIPFDPRFPAPGWEGSGGIGDL